MGQAKKPRHRQDMAKKNPAHLAEVAGHFQSFKHPRSDDLVERKQIFTFLPINIFSYFSI